MFKLFNLTEKKPLRMWRGKPFEGWADERYPDGQPKEAGEYRNGGRIGPWVFWRADGTKHAEGSYRQDRKTGKWTYFDAEGGVETTVDHDLTDESHETDAPAENGEIRDGRPWSGHFVFRHSNGAVKQEGAYAEGNKTGLWTAYSEKGAKWWQGSFDEDRKTGDWIIWHPSGGVATRGRYLDGERVGTWELFDPDGNAKGVETHDSPGQVAERH